MVPDTDVVKEETLQYQADLAQEKIVASAEVADKAKEAAAEVADRVREAAEDVANKVQLATEVVTKATFLASEKMQSPWKGWSFLYKLMFIVGVTLILGLSCLFPIISIQQTRTNNRAITINTQNLNKTITDDAIIFSNEQKIISNQDAIIANETKQLQNHDNSTLYLVAICKATPGCILPVLPNP